MKKLLLRKSKGNMGDILGTTFCLFLILITLWASIQFIQLMMIRRSVDDVGREFILLLEQKGELDSADRAKLDTRIRELFPNNPDIAVTYNETNVKKGYGQEVSLEIRVTVGASDLDIMRMGGVFKETYTFTTKQYSTAKHNK